MRGLRSIDLAAVLLAPICFACLTTAAAAQPGCRIEEAQRLFGQQPRPTAEVERLLKDCVADGSRDSRVYLFQGVMARDAGDRATAIADLRKAHELAPEAPNAALELGVTLEARDSREAREVYEAILARDPTSRPAMLGLARVARSQNRLGEAQEIYARLLAVNPEDPEALSGMAWLALARRDRREARAGFERVLTLSPGDEEAKTGLSKTPDVYRYLFATNVLGVTTSQGTSSGSQARGTAAVSPFDTLELGWVHYDNALSLVTNTGVSTLPSDDITVGYHRLKPLSYAASLVYDYREHPGAPTEHWIDGGLTLFFTDWLQGYGAYRQAFGDLAYDGRLFRAGLRANVTRDWQVAATVYDSQQASFHDYRDLWSWVVDVTYAGSRGRLLEVGVGATPEVHNVDLHLRGILPVADRIALQIVATHNSVNAATTLSGGLLFTW